MRGIMALTLVVAGMVLLAGCSSGDGQTGFNIGKNLMHKDSNLKIYLDGQEAKQNSLKKGLKGYSPFTVKEQVAGSPKFKYELIDPKKHGFVKNVMMQVHQKFEADFSDIADYVIHPADMNNPDTNMKPGVEYDLGNLGPNFKIMDRHNKDVTKVEFKPGVEYLLVFTIVADKSESVQVYFKTK
jgi:hypothetical protein